MTLWYFSNLPLLSAKDNYIFSSVDNFNLSKYLEITYGGYIEEIFKIVYKIRVPNNKCIKRNNGSITLFDVNMNDVEVIQTLRVNCSEYVLSVLKLEVIKNYISETT